jgi:glycosyltransferase involved in cell wall biosynthesis
MKRKLKIAQVAPLWFSIPPRKYGGTEWVIYNLAEGLAKRGHKVTLFASGDSKPPKGVKLVSVYPRSLIKDGISWQDNTYNMMNLSEAFRRADEFDIIHTHIDLWEVFFPPLVKTPCLHTIHNPLYSSAKRDSRLFIFNKFKNNNYIAISKSQKNLSRYKLNFAAVVYNGIRIQEFKFNPAPKDHFFWTARVDKYKGIENAIEIAEKAGIKLVLAGRLDVSQIPYFEKNIKPHLNDKIKFIGEYSREEKPKLFAEAKALLYPIEWHEPFGMNMVESMACGTPVIAFKMGSVPEVVKHKKTGFVVRNIKEAIQAVKKIDEIKREDCRKWVEENFTQEIMTKNYEAVYYKLLKK